MSCMADDIVHEFEKFESAKAIWKSLQEQYRIMSPTRLRAHIKIELGKFKCGNIKGITKHMRMLSSIITNLDAVGNPYINEQKCLTVVNSLPNHPDWNIMRFSEMHAFTTHKEVRHQVEVKTKRLCRLLATRLIHCYDRLG